MASENASERDYYNQENLKRLWDPNWRQNMFSRSLWYLGKYPVRSMEAMFDTYHPFTCNVCKRGPFTHTKLQFCSRCNVVQYCCRDHQTEDYKNHRKWCKTYVKVIEDEVPDYVTKPHDIVSFRDYTRHLTMLMEQKMDLPPSNSPARNMIALQPRCRRCFKSGAELSTNLKVCPDCCGVALCPACYKSDDKHTREQFHCSSERPKEECETLQLCMAATGMVVENRNPLAIPSSTDVLGRPWIPNDWFDYFERKRTDFNPVVTGISQMAPVVAFLTDGLSVPLTLHMILHKHVQQFTAETKELVVHIVGAGLVDLTATAKYVELIRLNPQLKTVHIIMVGPGVGRSEPRMPLVPVQQTNEYKVRSSCQAWTEFHHNLYHQVADDLVPPTIVICTLPGVSDDTSFSWRETFQYIQRKQLPCILTGYNIEQVRDDLEQLEQWDIDVILPPTPNPFRGLRPYLDPMRDPEDVFYRHAAYAVVGGGCT